MELNRLSSNASADIGSEGGFSRRRFLAGLGATGVGLLASQSGLLTRAALAAKDSGPKLRLGVMTDIGATDTIKLARSLGAVANRRVLFCQGRMKWPGKDPGIDALHRYDIKVVMTIRNSGTTHYDPSSPPSDYKVYASKIRAMIEEHQPKVVVIENEMSGETMYTGTATQYLRQLETAANVVAEFKGVRLADGGLPGAVVRDMTYNYFIEAGLVDRAESFIQRATNTAEEYKNATNGYRHWAEIGHSFLDGFADAGADLVNFHWYETDGLAAVADFLSDRTGLKPMSNEVGLRDKDDEQGQRRLMKQAKGKLVYFIQYSIDLIRKGEPQRSVYALQNRDLQLRPIGKVYKEFAGNL